MSDPTAGKGDSAGSSGFSRFVPPEGGTTNADSELRELIAAMCNGTATPPERDRLEQLLADDEEAQFEYLSFAEVHASFLWQHRGQTDDILALVAEAGTDDEGSGLRGCEKMGTGSDPTRAKPGKSVSGEVPVPIFSQPLRAQGPQQARDERRTDNELPAVPPLIDIHPSSFLLPQSELGGWLFSYAAAVVITGMLVLSAWVYRISLHGDVALAPPAPARHVPAPPPEIRYVGRIAGTADCRFADPHDVLAAAVPLGRKYDLASGLMEIAYASGARVILQGPCSYEVDSVAGGFLSLGKLTARVEKSELRTPNSEISNPQSPIPNPLFSVRTPTAIVTDLGTEFGVEVSKEGNTTSHVFRGRVEMRLGGNAGDRVIRLGKNESASVEIGRDRTTTVSRKAAQPTAFARRMPGRLPNRLVSYWNFDEGQGIAVHNLGLEGRKFDGTLMCAAKTGSGTLPRWVPGRFGKALEFTGHTVFKCPAPAASWSVNYVNVPGGGGLQFQNNVSVSLWVKWNGLQPAAVGVDAVDSSTNTNNLYGCVLGRHMEWRDTNAVGLNFDGHPNSCRGLRLKPFSALRLIGEEPAEDWSYGNNTPNDGACSFQIGSLPPGDGTWVHLVLAVDGGTYAMYLNGRLLRTLTNLPPLAKSGPLTIGALYSPGGLIGPSNSTIDDVGVFEWTLSAGMARAVYNVPRVAGLADYDLGKINVLFGVYDSAQADAGAVIGALSWTKTSGLTGHQAGDAWATGGRFFVQLDSAGRGVVGEEE